MESLYRKVKEEEEENKDSDLKRELKKRFKRIDEQMRLIDDRFVDCETNIETLEQKTGNNFKIAEKALLAHRDFINQLDARIVKEVFLI